MLASPTGGDTETMLISEESVQAGLRGEKGVGQSLLNSIQFIHILFCRHKHNWVCIAYTSYKDRGLHSLLCFSYDG